MLAALIRLFTPVMRSIAVQLVPYKSYVKTFRFLLKNHLFTILETWFCLIHGGNSSNVKFKNSIGILVGLYNMRVQCIIVSSSKQIYNY